MGIFERINKPTDALEMMGFSGKNPRIGIDRGYGFKFCPQQLLNSEHGGSP